MNIRHILKSAIIASFPIWGATLSDLKADAPRALTGDFDFCYCWYDFGTGLLADTWETSKYEFIEYTGIGNEYLIAGFMKEGLNPDPEDSSFTVETVRAYYDSADRSFTIPGNQYLFTYTNDEFSVEISAIGVKYDKNGKLTPDKDMDIVLKWNEYGFRTDPESECVAILFGKYFDTTDSYSGFGLATQPALCPWNGTMIYLVAPSLEQEAMPYTCNVWAEAVADKLSLFNFADSGYGNLSVFENNTRTRTLKGEDIKLQELTDILGDKTFLTAADFTSDYEAATADGKTVLTAQYSISQGATMILQQSWGAFFMGEPVGYYSNVYTLLDMDITKPTSGINVPADTATSDEAAMWYDLDGRRLKAKSKGISIAKTATGIHKYIVR